MVTNILNDVKLSCENDGCPVQIQYFALQKHILACTMKTETCNYCKEKLLLSQVPGHKLWLNIINIFIFNY